MDMVSEREPLLSIRDAARRIGVLPSRVRALAESGQLRGRKVGQRWVFSAPDVAAFADKPRVPGRPLSPRRSLGLLYELSGEPAAWLDRVERWKALHSQSATDPDQLVARSRHRAERIERRAHPSDLPRILSEPGVVRGGLSAAQDHGIELVVAGVIEIYVDRRRVGDVMRRYELVPSGEPNVILHVADVASALDGRVVMPVGVAIVDLLESNEPRAVAAARRAWKRLSQR